MDCKTPKQRKPDDLELVSIFSQLENALGERHTGKQISSPVLHGVGQDGPFQLSSQGKEIPKRGGSGRRELHKKVFVLPSTSEGATIPPIVFAGIKQEAIGIGKKDRATLLFLESFWVEMGESKKKKQFIVAQGEENCCAYIGCLESEGYRVVRRIALDSVLAAAAVVQDALVLGCRNGKVYAIDQCSQVLATSIGLQLGTHNVLGEGLHAASVKWLLCREGQGQIFVVHEDGQVRRFHYVPLADRRSSSNIFMCDGPNIKIQAGIVVKTLKYIKMEKCGDVCLVVCLGQMFTPCVLAPLQVEVWFPRRMAKLQSFHNRIVSQVCGEEVVDNLMQCGERIEGIETVEWHSQQESLIVGCKDGTVYVCSVVLASSIQPMQGSSEPTIAFKYLVQRLFAIKQPGQVLSIAPMIGNYICVASEAKVLFYDLRERTKFSATLRQKPTNVINCLRWTQSGLLLCCLLQPETKVYLYSNQLPIARPLCEL